jgi:hypothetical protein
MTRASRCSAAAAALLSALCCWAGCGADNAAAVPPTGGSGGSDTSAGHGGAGGAGGAAGPCVGPAQSEVVAAIATTTYGDTVAVCGGSATWIAQSQGCSSDSMLCMKKGINLRGGIGGTTIITLSGAASYGAIGYEPDATSTSQDTPFELAGFTIDAGGASYGEGLVNVRNAGSTPITRVRIHHNTFRNSPSETLLVNGPVYGVAYANAFEDCATVIKVEGGELSSWGLDQREYGTAHSFFFEDNTSVATTTASAGAFTAGQGGSLVVRYNTYDVGQILLSGNQWQDLHGLQSMSTQSGSCSNVQCGYPPFSVPDSCYPEEDCCAEWSQVKTEWYGNIHTNFLNPYSTAQEWLRLRGSWLLMFNNTISGTGIMPSPDIYQYSCDSCQSPADPAFSQHVQNTYVWNNMGSGTNRPIYVLQDNCGWYSVGTPYTLTENVDFWNYNPTPLNGGTQRGINCGSAAPTGACSTGDGYWQTSYSPCSTAPATMLDMKTYTQAGTFWRCVAPSTWASYYTPYAYPHPLRG